MWESKVKSLDRISKRMNRKVAWQAEGREKPEGGEDGGREQREDRVGKWVG